MDNIHGILCYPQLPEEIEQSIPPLPTVCGYVNEKEFWETTATLSADGNTLTMWGWEFIRQ